MNRIIPKEFVPFKAFKKRSANKTNFRVKKEKGEKQRDIEG